MMVMRRKIGQSLRLSCNGESIVVTLLDFLGGGPRFGVGDDICGAGVSFGDAPMVLSVGNHRCEIKLMSHGEVAAKLGITAPPQVIITPESSK